jgi:hypothetical protein
MTIHYIYGILPEDLIKSHSRYILDFRKIRNDVLGRESAHIL